MAYTLGTAAKSAGKSKTTILRAIEKGRISAEKSATGEWIIQPAELHRVYPHVKQVTVTEVTDEEAGGTPVFTRVTMAERESAFLREQLEREREISRSLEQDRDHWRQQATALLTDRREKAPVEAPGGRWSRAWSILRGKG